jgi:hypothetical protein
MNKRPEDSKTTEQDSPLWREDGAIAFHCQDFQGVRAVTMRNSEKPAKATSCRKMHRKIRTPTSSTKKASALFVPLRCSIGENKPLRPETREDGNAKESRAQRPFTVKALAFQCRQFSGLVQNVKRTTILR